MKKVLISLIVLVLVGGIGYYSWKAYKKQKTTDQNNLNSQPKLGEKIMLKDNSVPSEIPKDLVATQASVVNSYTIPYQGMNQSTVNFETNDSIKTVFDSYISTLGKDKYRIINQKYDPTISNIYAYSPKSTQDVNIVITKNPKDSKTLVILSYLNKGNK
ncbi:MAG: hypothetical protein NVSMB66_5740 [Candidatus Doudnabacteria bacterium]